MTTGRRIASGTTSIGLALLCLLAIALPSARATFPGQPGLIAFSKVEFHGPGAEITGGLFAIRPGQQPRQLTSNARDYDPSFAPDGSRLVFRRVDTPAPGIYMLDMASGNAIQVTTRESDLNPAFGPEGMIVFSRFVTSSRSYDLVLRTANGRLRHLTSGPATEEEPVFTPNGRRIIFWRNPGRAVALTRGDKEPGLYSIRVDGTGLKPLKGITRNGTSFDVSPDGRRLVFFRIRSGTSIEEVRTEAWSQKLGGGKPRLLSGNAAYPTFSPDGGSIAYSNHEGLWTLRADGTGAPTLLLEAKNFNDARPGSSLVVHPAWQPLP